MRPQSRSKNACGRRRLRAQCNFTANTLFSIRLDAETSRRLPAPADTPYCLIRHLDVATQAVEVEQGVREPVGVEPGADRLAQRHVAREFEGEGFVILEARRYEIGQTYGVDQACADAGGELPAGAGHHRHPGPQGVDRS